MLKISWIIGIWEKKFLHQICVGILGVLNAASTSVAIFPHDWGRSLCRAQCPLMVSMENWMRGARARKWTPRSRLKRPTGGRYLNTWIFEWRYGNKSEVKQVKMVPRFKCRKNDTFSYLFMRQYAGSVSVKPVKSVVHILFRWWVIQEVFSGIFPLVISTTFKEFVTSVIGMVQNHRHL